MNIAEIEFELAKIRSEVERQNRQWDKLDNWLKDKYKEHRDGLDGRKCVNDGYLQCLIDIGNYLFELKYNKESESEE